MPHFAAHFSDLSGPLNPTGIWSPTYVGLKKAVDGGDPRQVLNRLRLWLRSHNVPGMNRINITDIVRDRSPEEAYTELLRVINPNIKGDILPAPIKQTVMAALLRIAQTYGAKERRKIATAQRNVADIEQRFAAESLAARLLD